MPPSKPAGFWREANEEELLEALEQYGEELSAEDARLVLRNPFLTERAMARLLELRSLRSSYRFKRDLARARLVPIAVATSLVPQLYWRDLARLSTEVAVRPTLRRQAEQLLVQRLPKLALGERIALARVSGAGLIAELRKDPNLRVVRSLLENPRLREADLLPMLLSGGTPEVLELIATNPRWGSRRPIRLAVARNPRTPPAVALRTLPALSKAELKGLQLDRRVPANVRRRCSVLLGEAE